MFVTTHVEHNQCVLRKEDKEYDYSTTVNPVVGYMTV